MQSIPREFVGISLIPTTARMGLETTDSPAEWLPEGGLHQMPSQGQQYAWVSIIAHRLTYILDFTSYIIKDFVQFSTFNQSLESIPTILKEPVFYIHDRLANSRNI